MSILVLALALSFPSAQARAEPTPSTWPQWRGPSRDGHASGTPWPDALAAARIVEAWQVEGLGASYATPIVSESLVFTVGTVGKREEVATAFARDTGERVWETRWEGALSVPFFAAKNGSWMRSTPATDGDALFVGGMRDVLVCLDAATGAVRWRVDFVERDGTPVPAFGLVSSPLVDGDALYVQAGGALAKLDKRTGATLWRALEHQGGGMDSAFSSPILTTLAGRPQLVVQSRSHLSGVDPESGATLWSQAVKSFRGMNILTPLAHGDGLFTSAYGGRGHLFDVTAQATEDAPTTLRVAEVWTSRAQGYMTSPVLVDGHAYLFLRSNRFTCVDLATGRDTYISGPTGDEYWSLVAKGDRILALADTGRLRLIAANPASFDVLGEVDLVAGPSWAHLAVTGDEAGLPGADLFVRAQTSLHAFRWR